MNNKMKVLVVVDMQKDFVDGSLGTPEAQAIVEKVEKKVNTTDYTPVYNRIIYTFDTHYDNYLETFEGKRLPVKHCIYGTQGWSLAFNPNKLRENDTIKKTTFGTDAFRNYLAYTPDMIESIEIVGLCTDICVITNALILRTMFPSIPIIVDASCCAGTTPEAHKAALMVMKSCQIDIINE